MGPRFYCEPVRGTLTPPVRYQIAANLDTNSKTVAGRIEITFRNTSNSPLHSLCVHLYLNAFSGPQTLFMRTSKGCHRGQCLTADGYGSIALTALHANGHSLTMVLGKDPTTARIDLPSPLDPGEHQTIEAQFTAKLPKLFARTGYSGDFFMLGQWYPKLGFLQGDGNWQCSAYHGFSEFFSPFSSYAVSLTVPSKYVIGSTGVTVGQEATGTSTTYHLKAAMVHDFAVTAWPDFEVQEETLSGRTQNLSPLHLRFLSVPKRMHAASYRQLIREGIAKLERWLGPYPYTQLTVVDVPIFARAAGGMEYPTLFTTWRPFWHPKFFHFFEELALHELVHQYFQGIVATNEVLEPWLDEGLTTYLSGKLLDDLYGETASLMSAGPIVHLGQKHRLLQMHGRGHDPTPIATAAAAFPSWTSYVAAVYAGAMLLMRLSEQQIGWSAMRAALSAYVHQFRFRHPRSEDLQQVLLSHAKDRDRIDLKQRLNEGLNRGILPPVALKHLSLIRAEEASSERSAWSRLLVMIIAGMTL